MFDIFDNNDLYNEIDKKIFISITKNINNKKVSKIIKKKPN